MIEIKNGKGFYRPKYKIEQDVKDLENNILDFIDNLIDQVRKAKTDYESGSDLTGNFRRMELNLAIMANEITGE